MCRKYIVCQHAACYKLLSLLVMTTLATVDCECLPGYFQDEEGLCTPCPVATYKSETGNTLCTACPTHSVTLGNASVGASDCLCDKGYEYLTAAHASMFYGISEAGCYACIDANSYKIKYVKSWVGNEKCDECAKNALSVDGIQDCRCDAGMYSGYEKYCYEDGRCQTPPSPTYKYCYFCRWGTYFSNPSGICLDCMEDNYDTICRLCPDGTYDAGGTFYLDRCKNCWPNSVSLDNRQSCVCEPGFFETALHECSPCSNNTFKPSPGDDSCEECPANAMSEMGLECLCLPGYYHLTDGTCEPCPIGTYTDVHGSHNCRKCPLGTYFSQTAASSCHLCMSQLDPAYQQLSVQEQSLCGAYTFLAMLVLPCLYCHACIAMLV